MKHVIIIILLTLLSYTNSKGQESFIEYEWEYICDAISNINGGIKEGTGYLGMIKVDLSFDTRKAGLWNGGELFFSGMNTHGFEPSKELIGDFHTISNIEAGDNTFIHELWYKQSFGNFYIKLGITDLNTDFAVSEFGSFFLNSSFGLPSVVSGNIPVSTFPITNIGGIFHWQINEDMSIQTSLHKGIAANTEENKSSHYFKKGDGWTSFSEFSFNHSIIKGLQGRYKLGMFFHNHNNEVHEHETNYGIYLIGDQQLLSDSNGGTLSSFIQLGACPDKLNTNDMYFGFGFLYNGINKNRPKDALGLAIAIANFCDTNKKRESTIELNYSMPLHKHFSIQPCLQYVINPSQASQEIDNALVGILRIVIC